MALEQKPFVPYKLEEERTDKFETISLKINKEERLLLERCKAILEQAKDGTAIKQLMFIGAKVIHEDKNQYLLGLVFKNKRNNARIGVADFE